MEFRIEAKFNVSPEVIYKAWLNSKSHSAMTGAPASINDKPGSKFSAWDGYIEGENIELEKNRRIMQSWRTSDFDHHQDDSLLEIELLPMNDGGTKLILRHSNLEDHDMQYKKGWKDNYFEPMKKYFAKKR
ncbi:MAG: SRPBCC domain-containing protein [Saprospiraceae bacterium]|nr:SRPBCC domain-containing protein [Saprospiraceae bacterium]HMW39857.1 SRPBCC domain-containing protein [Saprospiraceae bacterium]HMX88720.1 SRPBCC domain-containing protein [Saprospiraceae bacterium]HMZ40733.1 SRPBCC domain-containing protein [Saprospiraceae bacterium]HNA64659.1 SRPBCC domain-containing protein [Saprospiraceae bacterium]